MRVPGEQEGLQARLMGPLNNILSQHSAALLPLLQAGGGAGGRAALQNDENVRKVATFCYPLLPALVRLAVKEPVFVGFVMNNREKVLERLVPATPATTSAGA